MWVWYSIVFLLLGWWVGWYQVVWMLLLLYSFYPSVYISII